VGIILVIVRVGFYPSAVRLRPHYLALCYWHITKFPCRYRKRRFPHHGYVLI